METSIYDLNADRALPRVVDVDSQFLPGRWAKFCKKNNVHLHAVLGYENEGKNIKIWPASGIIAGYVKKGEHLIGTDTIAESSSGNFVEGLAKVLDRILEKDKGFPLKRVVAVVTRSLQPGKVARLKANKRIVLHYADDATCAMKLAAELAQKNGYLYSRQYWNMDNPTSYKKMGEEIARVLPDLGVMVCGVGSGGTFTGIVPTLQETFADRMPKQRLFCVAVAVDAGNSVGGVRTEVGLSLKDFPRGFPWRTYADDVNYVGLKESLIFSSALWKQYPGEPEKRIIAGESSGFALAGGLLALLKLDFRDKLDEVRNENGEIVLAFVAPDTREPYRSDYEKQGISF